MIRRLLFAFSALAVCVALATDVVAGPISVGNLVVVQVGGLADGNANIAALAAASQRTFLKEFTVLGGAPVQTIAMPTTTAVSGNRALTNNGTATSEGFLAQSADGSSLVLAGYNSAVGGTNSGATSTTVNRVVGVVDINTGSVDTTTALNNTFSAGNIRGAAALNSTQLYVSGSNGGVQYTTIGSATSVQSSTAPTNVRVPEVAYGQLYVSSASGAFQSVASIGTGKPETSGQTTAILPGLPTTTTPTTHSPYDYWFASPTTLYIADDGAFSAGGGIQKWTFSAGTWSLQYILLNGGTAPTTTAVRGLTGFARGGVTTLYATTTSTTQGFGNSLIKIVDSGVGGGTGTVLAMAPANTAFRGVEYINIPEPASLALVGLLGLALTGLVRRR